MAYSNPLSAWNHLKVRVKCFFSTDRLCFCLQLSAAFYFPLHQCSLKLRNIFVNRKTCGLSCKKKMCRNKSTLSSCVSNSEEEALLLQSMQKNTMLCRGAGGVTACRNLIFGQNNSNVLTWPVRLVLKKYHPGTWAIKAEQTKNVGELFSVMDAYTLWERRQHFL